MTDFFKQLGTLASQPVVQVVISTLISTGVITAFLHHFYDKRIRTHERKNNNYFALIEQLSKFVSKKPDFDKLHENLNNALFFASDKVVVEILKFNKLVTERRQESSKAGQNSYQIMGNDLKPLIMAIRKELYLKSKSLKTEEISFFMGN